jgi:hypothetical protein
VNASRFLRDSLIYALRFPQLKKLWLASIAFGICTLSGATELDTQWSYKVEKEFQRISEFFTGKENLGKRIVLRSIPDQRDGLYFSLSIPKGIQSLPADNKAIIEILQPNTPDAQVYEYSIPSFSSKCNELMLGITGAHWPNEEDHPLAWRVRLLDSEGKVIASDQSYLWR